MKRRRLSFGAFRLDPVERRLWKGSEVVMLAPKPLAVLSYLAERPGLLATKEELGRLARRPCRRGGSQDVRRRNSPGAGRRCGFAAGYRDGSSTGLSFVAPIQCENVPTRTTSVIGRQRELQDVKSFLANSHMLLLDRKVHSSGNLIGYTCRVLQSHETDVFHFKPSGRASNGPTK